MKHIVWYTLMLAISLLTTATAEAPMPAHTLENPVTADWLQKHLVQGTPRLILTPESETLIKEKLKTDPVVIAYYNDIKAAVSDIADKPVLTYEKTGRRLLAVSRSFLARAGMLAMVYRIDGDTAALNRLDTELQAVCAFKDWNPSHFLDVAEMSMAVALALDWAGHALPAPTVKAARQALLDKGITPSFKPGNGWIANSNNWNQVCHGGMVAAALILADEYPDTTAHVISRALNNIPPALDVYAPDGAYPEGPMYWNYGTSYTILTIGMLRTALGTDFGIAEWPGFKRSAQFRQIAVAPSGDFFNYSDCQNHPSKAGDITLAWFAAETGNTALFETDKFLHNGTDRMYVSRFAGPGLVWLARFEPDSGSTLPDVWYGRGHAPVVMMRNDDARFFLGIKGGKGAYNHGNMDAGSFVLEIDGIRWSMDPGTQGYHDLEKTGFNLWGRCQTCDRWKLLTKNNFGHSTLTANDSLHLAKGFASFTSVTEDDAPRAVIDLSPVLAPYTGRALRTFVKESDHAVTVTDTVTVSDATRSLTWQMMTQADVTPRKDGADLVQDNGKLSLTVLGPKDAEFSVVPLDPPPLELDKTIEGFKRIEVRVDTDGMKPGETCVISVRLSSASE